MMVRGMVAAALTGVFAYVVAAWVRRHAARLRLVDVPNHRSSHVQPTPRGGGVGIALGGLMAGAAIYGIGNFLSWAFMMVCLLSFLLATVGLRDDIRPMSARKRLAVHFITSAGLVWIFGSPYVLRLPLDLTLSGGVVFMLLCLAGMWWINLFNFMDGIDGLAGLQATFMLVAALGLAVWGHPHVLHHPGGVWMMCVAAATLGFLWLNWPPAKIFMGDVGSTYLACMIFFFALTTVQQAWVSYAVWLVLAALFITDASLTLLARVWRGERLHEAHRSHGYQRLSARWGSHRKVTLLSVAINLLWLLPLAWACLLWPGMDWAWVMMAYLPLVLGWLVIGRLGPAK